jgi:Superinfection immunity protein
MAAFGIFHLIMLLLVIAVLIVVHFLPSIIAFKRGHHNRVAIFVLNLLLGWTFIGWVVALVWACTAIRPQISSP